MMVVLFRSRRFTFTVGMLPPVNPRTRSRPRVAKARGVSAADLQGLVDAATEHAVLGYIGQDGVNVTRLNLALANR